MAHGAANELVGRTLCDIAHLLESVDGAEPRVRGALQLLGNIVPYQQCALLDAEPGRDPLLIAVPGMGEDEEHDLAVALVKLFGKLLEERALPHAPVPGPWTSHLAVPLIGLDEVIGVLFVSRAAGPYAVGSLRVLSLVAAQLAAYLMMLRANTEETARAGEAEQARCVAKAALRAKVGAVTAVADELRAPLAAVSAWVRALAAGDLPPGARARALEAIEHSIRTQDRLVRDLFEISSVSGLHLELGAVQPAGVIEAAVEGLRPLAQQRSILLESALDRAVGPMMVDAGRLDEVLAILLANAFRSTSDGGHVQVRLEQDGAGARIQVIDSGRGFSPSRLSHLFECSGLPEGPAAPGRDGSGIGLAIARHLVELHGGSIQAESPGEGKGATFTVGLPNARR